MSVKSAVKSAGIKAPAAKAPSSAWQPPAPKNQPLREQAKPTDLVDRTLSSPGRGLDPETRANLEPRLGHDFSGVRLHTGDSAAESARAINARAYTVGNHVVLGNRAPSPRTNKGQELMAHELTHVVQQSRGKVSGTPIDDRYSLSHPSDPHERDARNSAATARRSEEGPSGENSRLAPLNAQASPVRTIQRDTPDNDEVAKESRNSARAGVASAVFGGVSAVGSIWSAYEAMKGVDVAKDALAQNVRQADIADAALTPNTTGLAVTNFDQLPTPATDDPVNQVSGPLIEVDVGSDYVICDLVLATGPHTDKGSPGDAEQKAADASADKDAADTFAKEHPDEIKKAADEQKAEADKKAAEGKKGATASKKGASGAKKPAEKKPTKALKAPEGKHAPIERIQDGHSETADSSGFDGGLSGNNISMKLDPHRVGVSQVRIAVEGTVVTAKRASQIRLNGHITVDAKGNIIANQTKINAHDKRNNVKVDVSYGSKLGLTPVVKITIGGSPTAAPSSGSTSGSTQVPTAAAAQPPAK